jgi:RNA polymerase sigma-70 factor (ECF subfamily)
MPRTPTPAPPSDEALRLAAGLRNGEVQALEGVIRTLGPRIAAGLSRRHPSLRTEDIEDVLSVASHRLWESREQYEPSRGSLAAWFFIIADNVACDLVRKEARRLERPAKVDHLAAPVAPRPWEASEGDPAEPELHEILGDLLPVDRRIISAYAHAGGAGAWAADLSRELGMRAGTIRVRCRRIKERLRKALHARQAACGAGPL